MTATPKDLQREVKPLDWIQLILALFALYCFYRSFK